MRYHLRLLQAVLRALVRIGGVRGREPEFLLQLTLDRNYGRDVDVERQLEVQSWLNLLQILAEALHDSDGVTRHGVKGRPNGKSGQKETENQDHPRPARSALRQLPSDQVLCSANQLLEVGPRSDLAAPRAASVAVTALRLHLHALADRYQ